MVDITMCSNDNCCIKHTCFRNRATPHKLQWYGYYEPTRNTQDDFFCPDYVEYMPHSADTMNKLLKLRSEGLAFNTLLGK